MQREDTLGCYKPDVEQFCYAAHQPPLITDQLFTLLSTSVISTEIRFDPRHDDVFLFLEE